MCKVEKNWCSRARHPIDMLIACVSDHSSWSLDDSFDFALCIDIKYIYMCFIFGCFYNSTFEGEWHRFDDAGLNPRPVQQPIPIWFGAVADVALRRAGKLGDGLLVFPLLSDPDEARIKIDLFLESAVAAGRDPASLGVDATIYARELGSDEWNRAAEDWKTIGATDITFRTSDSGFATIDDHLAAMERFIAG